MFDRLQAALIINLNYSEFKFFVIFPDLSRLLSLCENCEEITSPENILPHDTTSHLFVLNL